MLGHHGTGKPALGGDCKNGFIARTRCPAAACSITLSEIHEKEKAAPQKPRAGDVVVKQFTGNLAETAASHSNYTCETGDRPITGIAIFCYRAKVWQLKILI